MVDWNTGQPNARYWVLKLLRDNFGPGDELVEIEPGPFGPSHPYLYSLGVVTKDGKRRVLLVNKRDRAFDVAVSGASGGQMDYVDQSTAMNPPASARLTGDTLKVNGLGVAVVTLS